MKYWISAFFSLSALILSAQPSNDDCSGAIDLGVAPYCEDVYYSNEDATPSNIGVDNIPPCWDAGTVQRDVWFSFIASDTILDYSVTVTGETDMGSNPMLNPQVAVYRGDCGLNELFFFDCFKAISGENFIKFSMTGLTPGATYWLRIADYPQSSMNNAGSFKLCIEKKSPITNIIEGFSKECEGQLVDSGGPDENYGPNETYIFTICPEFPSACIDLNFIYYHIDFTDDEIVIYDGPDDNSPVIGTINGTGSNPESWGGVCKRFSATSGCITVKFTSNDVDEYEGFLAEWKCSPVPCKQYTQPTIQNQFTESEILNTLSSSQTIVSFDTLICADGAYGLFFGGDQTDLGLKKGILLTTGNAQLALGPNDSGSSSGLNGTFGDDDLDILSELFGNGTISNDACILELDVYANTNELTFEYVFGSEEYPEFVNSNFNDIFAFLISGPGITGIPEIGGQDNMAVLPNGEFVQINSVNYASNWEYYRSNLGGQSIEYDGLTSDYLGTKKSLTARYNVTPCKTYHLKLAIADRGDSSYDSGVFISEIKGGAPGLSVNYNNGIEYLVENCTNIEDEVIISLNSALDDTITYQLTIGGSATLGVDYLLSLPSSITFLPGQTSFSFPIVPLNDLITEGDETVTITLSNDFGCGSVSYSVLTIIIRDQLVVTVNADQDTAYFCPGNSISLTAKGAQDFFWQPVSIFNDPTSGTTLATPTGSMWVTVTGTLGVCTDVDSIYLFEVNPQVSIVNATPDSICQGESVIIVANSNLNGQGSITWTPAFGLSNPKGLITEAFPNFSQSYVITAELTGCMAKDTIAFVVDPFQFPNLVPDQSLCEGSSIQLAPEIFFPSTTYQWTPDETLDDGKIAGPVASPLVTTTYTVVAESQSGICKDSASVKITVVPAAVDILASDIIYLCKGDSIEINANFTPGGVLTWLPKDTTLITQNGNAAFTKPTKSFMAYASMTVGPCTVVDSVFIRVDSLPDLAISKFIDRPFYCEGEIITFLSPAYLNKDYPDIQHLWSPSNGSFLSADSNLNMVLTAKESFTYTRQTVNNACAENQSVYIEVIPVGLSLSATDITLCPGDTMQVFILNDSIDNIMWMPSSGLSCTTCPNPIVTGISTGFYEITGEEKGCNKQGKLNVTVPIPVLDLPSELIVCLGESTNLNPNAGGGTSYFWTSTDPSFGTSNAANPSITPLSNATYYVTATFQGCERTGEVNVAVITEPAVTLQVSDTSICFGESVTLTAAGTPVGGTYLWSPGNQTTPSITVSPPVSTEYKVTYTTVLDCFEDDASSTISVDPVIGLTLTSDPVRDTFLLGEPLKLTVTPSITPPAGSFYTWFIDGKQVQNTTGPMLEVTTPAPPFNVLVQLTTPAGCIYEIFGSWFVRIPQYDIPNVFTPNGDNTNDYFIPFMDPGIEIAECKVYSRWGNLVYDNEDPSIGWDGTKDGKDLPSEVYGYKIVLRFGDGSTKTVRGDITLVR
ncbi:MAG: choice-of-anchor L domain-containing protein [Saprospiraceae bacterium]|nr:choice-of-anchor L domain-containing protein [Saprospiraceae bacterium]